jgi:hypothetical protein
MLSIAPSFNSLFLTGILILSIFIIFVINFNKIMTLGFYQKITLLSIITIAIGVHGLIHLGLEVNYGFNPYKLFNI